MERDKDIANKDTALNYSDGGPQREESEYERIFETMRL